jgi:hypothetical protein
MEVNELIRTLLIIMLFYILINLVFGHNKINISNEGFDNYNAFNGGMPLTSKSCPDCTNLSNIDCINCDNCGICIKENGNVECMPGDIRGPYFDSTCKYWINRESSSIYGSTNDNKNIKILRPWSYLYQNNTFDHFGSENTMIDMPRWN